MLQVDLLVVRASIARGGTFPVALVAAGRTQLRLSDRGKAAGYDYEM